MTAKWLLACTLVCAPVFTAFAQESGSSGRALVGLACLQAVRQLPAYPKDGNQQGAWLASRDKSTGNWTVDIKFTAKSGQDQGRVRRATCVVGSDRHVVKAWMD